MKTEDTAEFIDPGADDIEEGQGDEAVASAEEQAGDKPEDKTGGKGAGKDDGRAELNSLRARVTAAEEATRYWHEQARGAAARPARAEETPDKPLSVDLVDAISSGNKKQIQTALNELGFVDRSTMDAHIAAARQQGMTEASIMQKYPELADNESAFFKATQKEFAELVADGADPNSLLTTRTAAKLASKTTAREAERGDRIRRQAGDRGARPSSRGRDGASDELDNQQLNIIERFKAAGAPITEEGYKKRAGVTGVSMAGVKTRRAA